MNDLQIAKRYVRKAEEASTRGIIFSLSFSNYKKLVTCKRCYYTNLLFDSSVENGPLSRTIDRMDNTKGYTDDNCVAAIYRVNQGKGSLLLNDIILMSKKLEKVAKSHKEKEVKLKKLTNKLSTKYKVRKVS